MGNNELLSPEELKLKEIKDLEPNVKLEKKYFYRVKRGEIFRYIDNDLYSGLIKVGEEPSGIEDRLFQIKIPKIPYELMKRIVDFFKLVYLEYESEAVILLWYNFDTDVWKIEIPEQIVQGAGVDYERDDKDIKGLEADGFTLVGSVHSHADMGAFHSGTDDHDEYKFDGVHVTVGKITLIPEFACRFISKENAYELEPENCFDWKEEKLDVPKSWRKKVTTKEESIKIVGGTTTKDLTRQNKDWWKNCPI